MGQVTLFDLLLGFTALMPAQCLAAELWNNGSRVDRYLVGLPIAAALGAALAFAQWHSGKQIWLRTQRHSRKMQQAVAVALLAMDLAWIGLGFAAGRFLAGRLV